MAVFTSSPSPSYHVVSIPKVIFCKINNNNVYKMINWLLRSSENQEKYAQMYKVALNFGDRTVFSILKKVKCHKIFDFLGSFMSYLIWGHPDNLGSVIFNFSRKSTKIRVFAAQGALLVSTTQKTSDHRNIWHRRYLPTMSTPPVVILFSRFALIVMTPRRQIATGVSDAGGKLPLVKMSLHGGQQR